MASILIIYGSTGGNTEMVAEKVAIVLAEKGNKVIKKRVEKSSPHEMSKFDLSILASPTYGHGILQEDFIPFYKALQQTPLKNHRCAVIGLGDPKYDAQYHIESATILEDVIKKNEGQLILHALKISRSPVPHLDTKIKKWTEELNTIITNYEF